MFTVYVDFVTGVEPIPGLPTDYELSQNYPNPFNPVTIIRYALPNTSLVQLVVYDLIGQEVTTLVNEELPPGRYETQFLGSNLPSGVYFYQLRAGTYLETKKMVLQK